MKLPPGLRSLPKNRAAAFLVGMVLVLSAEPATGPGWAAATSPSSTKPSLSQLPAGYVLAKQKANSSREASFLEIARRLADNDQMKMVHERLAAIDSVAQQTLAALEAIKASGLDGLLGELTGASGEKPMPRDPAKGLLKTFQGQFEAALPKPPLSEAELAILAQYCGAALQAAAEYVAAHGAISGCPSPETMNVSARLCLVLPFLQTADPDWTPQQTEQLPEWMRTPEALAACEAFALENRRHVTAFCFAACRLKHLEASSPPLDQVDYFSELATARDITGDYAEEVSLLQTAMAAAGRQERLDKAEALRFRLAEAHKNSAQYALAAAEYGGILKDFAESPKWGQAALERLTCLYQAQAFEAVAQEGERYRADPRCKSCLPQLTYVNWVACRKLNRLGQADALGKWFLQQYPDHRLGADMVFADAMTKLTEGDYAKSAELLTEIESRYPDSSMIPRVQAIRSRLDRFTSKQGSTQETPTPH